MQNNDDSFLVVNETTRSTSLFKDFKTWLDSTRASMLTNLPKQMSRAAIIKGKVDELTLSNANGVLTTDIMQLRAPTTLEVAAIKEDMESFITAEFLALQQKISLKRLALLTTHRDQLFSTVHAMHPTTLYASIETQLPAILLHHPSAATATQEIQLLMAQYSREYEETQQTTALSLEKHAKKAAEDKARKGDQAASRARSGMDLADPPATTEQFRNELKKQLKMEVLEEVRKDLSKASLTSSLPPSTAHPKAGAPVAKAKHRSQKPATTPTSTPASTLQPPPQRAVWKKTQRGRPQQQQQQQPRERSPTVRFAGMGERDGAPTSVGKQDFEILELMNSKWKL